jgi:hypothetical protein
VGGRNFLARHSPLIMFEIKAGDKVNEHLRALVLAIGYRLFRQLGGAPILAWLPSADNCKIADAFWRCQKFAPLINLPDGNGTHEDADYRNTLAAYATWRAAARWHSCGKQRDPG